MNKRQIPFLYPRPLAGGRTAWDWKPSPRLARLGWTARKLGNDEHDAIRAALDLNRQLAEWEAARLSNDPLTLSLSKGQAPRKWTFADLVDAYRASPGYTDDLAPATRREYDSWIKQLLFWANDGQLLIAQIDEQMVFDLKEALLAQRKPDRDPRFKAAAMLRVLRLLLRWAAAPGRRLIVADPTATVPIPTPPSRTGRLDWAGAEAAATLADAAGQPIAARYLRLAFWMMQRRGDMVAVNRFQWRELHGLDPRDLPALVNDRGQAWGFRLQQQKTGRWVDCPLPPFLHAEVETAFRASEWLFPHSLDPARPMSGDVIRRHVKPALDAAGFPQIQLRDLRRSGMSWVKDMGALKSDVFAVSGHPLDGQTRTMADVYMPPDSMAAGRAIAAAERTRQLLLAREREGQG